MQKNLKVSKSEQLMIEVLKNAPQSLNMGEIVKAIQEKDSSVFTGKTPEKSLYSTIYKREKKRNERGFPSPFIVTTRGGSKYYKLNIEDN